MKDDSLNLIYSTDNFINSPSYKKVSNYWQSLNIKNYNSILGYGLDKLTNEIFIIIILFFILVFNLIEKSTQHLTDIEFKL